MTKADLPRRAEMEREESAGVASTAGKLKSGQAEVSEFQNFSVSEFPLSAFAPERLLVVQWDGQRLVFPVDEVHGIQRFQKEELKGPPATVSHSALTYTRGVFDWRKRTVGLLEADALFAALNRSLA